MTFSRTILMCIAQLSFATHRVRLPLHSPLPVRNDPAFLSSLDDPIAGQIPQSGYVDPHTRTVRSSGIFVDELITKMLACPLKDQYVISNFQADAKRKSYEQRVYCFWISLLCKRFALSQDIMNFIQNDNLNDEDYTYHLAGIQTTIQMDHPLFTIILNHYNATGDRLKHSVMALQQFMYDDNTTPLTALDVTNIIGGREKAIALFTTKYYEGLKTKWVKEWLEQSSIKSPFYYVKYAELDGNIRSADEQWRVAVKIIECAPKGIWDLFFGDVFFISIMRDMLLLACDDYSMVKAQEFINKIEQFQYRSFMCADFWWKNIQFCSDHMLQICGNTSTATNTPQLSSSKRARSEGRGTEDTLAATVIKARMSTILSMEPLQLSETESDYVLSLSTLKSLNIGCHNFAIVFGTEYTFANNKTIKLSPLISIPYHNARKSSMNMQYIRRRYEVIVPGTTDVSEWRTYPGTGQYWYDLENISLPNGIVAPIGHSQLPAIAAVPGRVFYPGRDFKCCTPARWSQHSESDTTTATATQSHVESPIQCVTCAFPGNRVSHDGSVGSRHSPPQQPWTPKSILSPPKSILSPQKNDSSPKMNNWRFASVNNTIPQSISVASNKILRLAVGQRGSAFKQKTSPTSDKTYFDGRP